MAKKNKFETNAIHVGNKPDASTGSVSPPINLTSTFAQDGIGKNKGFDYSRRTNPTRERLEKNIASLEGGYDAIAFSSGMAATTALFQSLKQGDHVIISRNVYGGTYRLFTTEWARFGLNFAFVDTTNPDMEIPEGTRLVWIETPTNPLLKTSDIEVIAQKCKDVGALLVVDNTFATPVYQRPIELGADIVVHSMTKYLNGHSDVIGGIVVTSHDDLAARLTVVQNSCGAVPAPMDCFLVLRGLQTLHFSPI